MKKYDIKSINAQRLSLRKVIYEQTNKLIINDLNKNDEMLGTKP